MTPHPAHPVACDDGAPTSRRAGAAEPPSPAALRLAALRVALREGLRYDHAPLVALARAEIARLRAAGQGTAAAGP